MNHITALIDEALDTYRYREVITRREWLDAMLDLRLAVTQLAKELEVELIPQRDVAFAGSDLSVG